MGSSFPARREEIKSEEFRFARCKTSTTNAWQLVAEQMKEGSLDIDLKNVSLTAMSQWPLKQHLPALTEAQLFSHSDTSKVSKDQVQCAILSNWYRLHKFFLGAYFIVDAPSIHCRSDVRKHGAPGAEGNGFYGSEGDRIETDGGRFTNSCFGRSEIRGDQIDRVDEMRSLRRSSSRNSRRFSFVGNELISKSPRTARNCSRDKSRFAKPAEPEKSKFIGGKIVPRSSQLRSGPLKSQQLKSEMVPRTE